MEEDCNLVIWSHIRELCSWPEGRIENKLKKEEEKKEEESNISHILNVECPDISGLIGKEQFTYQRNII